MTTPHYGGEPRAIGTGRLGRRLAEAMEAAEAERRRAEAKDAEIAALRQTVHALAGKAAPLPPPEFVMAYNAAKRGRARFHAVILGQQGMRKGFVLDAEAIRRSNREPEEAWPDFLRMMG